MLRVDWNLLFTIINLLVLFVAMRVFLFKPVQKIIAERQEEADRQQIPGRGNEGAVRSVRGKCRSGEKAGAERGKKISRCRVSAYYSGC